MKLCVYTNGQWLTVKTDPRFSTVLIVKPEDGDHIEMAEADEKHVRHYMSKDIIVPNPRDHEHQIDIIV